MKGKKTQARERKEGAGNEKGKKVQQRERKKGTGNEEGKEVPVHANISYGGFPNET